MGLGISACFESEIKLVLKYFSVGTFWCYIHSGTPQYCCCTKKSILFQFHILWAMDFRAPICSFAPTENCPTHKRYGSVSNICAWKSVASWNGKRLSTTIVKNVLGDILLLKKNSLCTPTIMQFHPGLSAL